MIRRGTWRVEILPQARHQLLALRMPIQKRLWAAIRSLADDAIPPDAIPMRGKGTGLHRLRVGIYRVIYRIHAERVTVMIIRVGHRRDVYSGWE
jgi:mRNA interferase RelE/StbE